MTVIYALFRLSAEVADIFIPLARDENSAMTVIYALFRLSAEVADIFIPLARDENSAMTVIYALFRLSAEVADIFIPLARDENSAMTVVYAPSLPIRGTKSPVLPPCFSRRRISPMVIWRSTALSMS